MLEQLKRLNLENPDVEELVELSLFARGLHTEFEQLGVEVPSWLDDRTRELRRQVKIRLEDQRAARLRELKARHESLATPAEKRQKIADEIAKLEQAQVGT